MTTDMAGCTRHTAMEVGSTIHESDVHSSKRNRASARTDNQTLQEECHTCKAERSSKARVTAHANDTRFQSEKFSKATAIFAHNDVKYDTNKTRAKLFAARQKKASSTLWQKTHHLKMPFESDLGYALRKSSGCNAMRENAAIYTVCCR